MCIFYVIKCDLWFFYVEFTSQFVLMFLCHIGVEETVQKKGEVTEGGGGFAGEDEEQEQGVGGENRKII